MSILSYFYCAHCLLILFADRIVVAYLSYRDRYVQRTSHMVQRKEFLQNNQHPADELSSKNVFKE